MIKTLALLTFIICFLSYSANSKIGVKTGYNILPAATLKCFV